MYIVSELKLNKYVKVRIPSNNDLFGRFGARLSNSEKFTGDEPAISPMSKIDALSQSLNDYEDYCLSQSDEE